MRFLIALLLLSGCVSSSKTIANSANAFDGMPLCSRLMYGGTRQIVPVGELDPSFHQIAVRDSKTIWQATQKMKLDASSEASVCEALSVTSLLEKPEGCSSGWSGPYIEAPLATKYSSLSERDFDSFINCWRQK